MPLVLSEDEFKSDEIINLSEKTSKHLQIQDVAWVLLTSFSQCCSMSWEQKDLINILARKKSL